MQVIHEEHSTLLVLTHIVERTMVRFIGRNQAILVSLQDYRLHVIVVLDCTLHKLILVLRK